MSEIKFVVGQKKLEKALNSPVEASEWQEGVDYIREEKEGVERLLFSEEALLKAKRKRLEALLGRNETSNECNETTLKVESADLGQNEDKSVLNELIEHTIVTRLYPNSRFVRVNKVGDVRAGRFQNKLRVGMRVRVANNVVVGL